MRRVLCLFSHGERGGGYPSLCTCRVYHQVYMPPLYIPGYTTIIPARMTTVCTPSMPERGYRR